MAKRDDTACTQDSADLSTKRGASELVSYLVVRFILVLLAVIVVEQIVVIGDGLLLPPLQALVSGREHDAAGGTSLFSVFAGLTGVLWDALFGGADGKTLGAVQGSLITVLVLALLLLLVLPPFLGALGFSRIVVRRVRALQEQRELELAQIDQRRSRFITDIAHDLRTPLMAISGMAHAISDGVVRDDEMRGEYMQAICEKADKMSELVSSVFDYTKLGGGAFALDRENVDLPQLLLREAATAFPDAEEAGMTFSVQVPEDRCIVRADPVQLARVVTNLLVNAMRHNDPGAEIALLLVRRAGIAYVVVADSGAPIADDPEALFQPFSRGDAARSPAGGSGLGLSICKRIADMHGYSLMLVQPYGRFVKAFVLACAVL